MALTKRDYALIHIRLKDANISDDEYRALLGGNFGVESSKQLNRTQFNSLLSLLNELTNKRKKERGLITTAQAVKINQLAKGCIHNLLSFINKITGNSKIKRLDDLTKQEAITIIEAIKRYHKE